MAGITDYTEEKAAIVIAALTEGRRPVSAAKLAGTSRASLYRWRDQFEEFAEQWDQAVAAATDRLEEVVYGLALQGDLQAATYWLKHHRPNPYDRATLVKLGLIQAALAARQSGDKAVVDIGPDGLPLLIPPTNNASTRAAVMDGGTMQPIKVAMLPDNGRAALELPVCDGSGRTMPLPRRCMVFIRDDVVVRMSADSHPVPPGAIPGLWERVQRYNALCAVTGLPLQTFTNSEARSVVEAMRSRQWEADAREAGDSPDLGGDPEPPILDGEVA